MIQLNVWLTLPSGEICLVGELIAEDPEGRKGSVQGQFRYAESYLERQDAFPLDPNALPLEDRVFDTERPRSGVHGVFEDALPDDWGRRLLVRRYALTRQEQRVPNLLARLGQGLGALGFGEASVRTSETVAEMHSLTDLLQAAQAFEAGEPIDDRLLSELFQAGSSPGGARPKALISDNDAMLIAKFPSIKDQFDMVALEAASLHLAGQAGITVPNSRVHRCGERQVLLSERFDVTSATGRRHVISMQTLLQAEGYYFLGYGDIADCLRLYSDRPGADLQELYRRMVFNAAIGNTDDHLKNFAMLHDDGYRLTPAFDLIPNCGENIEHVLQFNLTASPPGRQELLSVAKRYNLTTAKAAVVVDDVIAAVVPWQQVFQQFEVPEQDIRRLSPDITARLKRLSQNQ